MPQNNNYNKKPGQILLIFIIALAILSIFVVVIAINVRRDTVETTQNDQYEAFYSLSEEKMLQLLAGELDPSECTIIPNTTNYNCIVPYEGSTLNLSLTETTTPSFENYPLEKDQSLKIGLEDGTDTGYQGAINFSYSGAPADWNITIDYLDRNGFYSVSKKVYSSDGLYYPTPSNDGCTFTDSGTYIRFEINRCFPGGQSVLALRMKPIMTSGTVNLSLYGDAGLPAQMRTIEAVSTVAQLSAEAGNTPRIVLQIMQPIHETPIEILDYVLRSDTDIDK